MAAPKLSNIKRHNGIAGNFSYTATVQYDGELPTIVAFSSSVYGAPIVLQSGSTEVFVDRAVLDRIGSRLDESWVRAFFAEVDDDA